MMTVVTSRLSRAWVHRAWMVYMALPSASTQTVLRPGVATAAPVAAGRPWPMAPPGKAEPIMRGGASRPGRQSQAGGDRLVHDDRTLREAGPDHRADGRSAERRPAGGEAGRDLGGRRRPRRSDDPEAPATRSAKIQQGGQDVLARIGQPVHCAAGRNQVARPVRIGEEGHRRRRPHKHQMADPGQLGLGLLGEVPEPIERRPPGPSLEPGWKGLHQHPGPTRGGDTGGGQESRLPQGAVRRAAWRRAPPR